MYSGSAMDPSVSSPPGSRDSPVTLYPIAIDPGCPAVSVRVSCSTAERREVPAKFSPDGTDPGVIDRVAWK
jgi:hypothetical protein